MICPKCKFDNPAGMTFCGKCGTSLSRLCPSCGFENPLDFTFCGKCGYDLRRPAEAVSALRRGEPQAYTPRHLADKILTTRPTMEGERKQVTVLFADVSGFTSISEKLDPEEVHALMNRCLEFFMDEIHRYEGTITQFTGDGVMALFGAPIAHEDAPQRALYAALGIQRSLNRYAEELKREQGIEFQIRIGVNTGPVVVGKIGDDLTMEYTAVGDTVNVAARMEQMAEPGAILVAEATQRLAEGYFEFKPLGPVEVKGKAEPVTVYEVVGLGPIRSRIEAAEARGLTRFVGRIPEMEHLMVCHRRVKEGQGQVVGIVGEAGVGKSRLLLEFLRSKERHDLTYLEGHCIHYGESMSYYPFIEMVKRYCAIEDTDREFIYRKKLRDRVLGLDPGLERFLPFLQDLLSLKVEDEAFARMEPEQRRAGTFEAIKTLLIRESEERPVVLAIEDMHWIDRSSEELLTHLIEGIANARILLLCLYRPEYRSRWGELSYYSKLGVDQLSMKTSATLVQSLLEEGKVKDDLRDLILGKAGGNPLFAEEVTRSLLDTGAIARSDDQYVLTRKPSEIEVPDTLQAVIAARIDRLEEALKRVLQVASVIGKDFAFRVLRSILEMEEELKRHLANLQGLEFIYEKRLFPELEYVFKHALTQEVAYSSLLIQRRKEFHKRIAQAMEELYSERIEEYYPMLAHHYLQGEDLEKALHYLSLSGDRALSLYCHQEAIGHYEGALEALSRLPDNLENKRKGLQIRYGLSAALYPLGYYQERELQVARESEKIALEIEDRRALIEVYGVLGHHFLYRRGDRETGLEYGEKSLAVAEETGDIELIAPSAFWLALTYFLGGQFRRSIALLQRVIDLQDTTPEIIKFAGTELPVSPWSFGLIARQRILLGEYDDSLRYAEKGLEMAEELNDLDEQAWCHFQRGLCYVVSGRPDWEKGMECLEKALPMWEQVGRVDFKLWTYAYLGYGYHLRGDLDQGREYLEKASALRELGLGAFPECLRLRADVHLGLGETQNALECCQEGLSIALNTKSKWHEWYSRQGLGEVYTAMGPEYYEEAEKHFLESIRLAEEGDARPDVAISYRGLGILYKEKGQPEKARECLSRAITMFEEMGMVRDLAKAREALDSLR